MNEITWGMPVVIYLFLAGLGAGSYCLGVISSGKKGGGWEAASRMSFLIAPAAIFIGLLMLILDLRYRIRFWRTLAVFSLDSPMSVGAWLLSIFFLISVISALFLLPEVRRRIPVIGRLAFWNDPKRQSAIGRIGIAPALGVSVYTGVLLSAASIPLWRNLGLPLLFFISALSLGMEGGAILGMMSLKKERRDLMKEPLQFLRRSYRIMLPLYLFAALLFTGILAVSSKEAMVHFMMSWGGLVWWVGVVFAGIVLPLILVMRKSGESHAWLFSGCILLGDFLLRMVLIFAGQGAL